MCSNVEVCVECRRRCLLLHGEKNSSPRAPAFFKILFGEGILEVLPLPPLFAPTVAALVDQKTLLVDSNGQQWEVTISIIDGSLAFQQGWNDFVLAHGLGIGDFVLFDYIGSRFFVRIFNSTVMEQHNFSSNSRQRKRTRPDGTSNSEDSSCYVVDEGSMNHQQGSSSALDVHPSQRRGKVNDKGKALMVAENTNCENSYRPSLPVCRADYSEEPFYMIGRDLGGTQGEDRSPIFDLSNFEMRKNNSGVAEKNKAAVEDHHADTSPRSPIEAALVDKEDVLDIVVASSTPDTEMIMKNNSSEDRGKLLIISDKVSAIEDERSPHHADALVPSANEEAGLVDEKALAAVVPSNSSDIEMIYKDSRSEDMGKLLSISDKVSAVEDERSPHRADALVRSAPEEAGIVDKDKEDPLAVVVPSNSSDIEMIYKDSRSEDMGKLLSISDKVSAVEDERSPHHADALVRSAPEEAGIIDKDKEDPLAVVVPSNSSHLEMIRKDSGSEDMGKLLAISDKISCNTETSEHLLTTSAVRPRENGEINSATSRGNIEKCQVSHGRDNAHSKSLSGNDEVVGFRKESTSLIDSGQSSQQNLTRTLECTLPDTVVMQNCHSGGAMRIVKREPMEITERKSKDIFKRERTEIDPELGGHEKMIQETGVQSKIIKLEHGQSSNMFVGYEKNVHAMVKIEIADSVGVSSSSAQPILIVVVTGKLSCLELPNCLPSANKGKMKADRKVVYLRDPVMRLWPVLYHNRLDFKLLSSGWEAFCKLNNIQPGDTCNFEVEDESADMYRVGIVKKLG